MSAIDSYKHEQIGYVRCPMRHSLFHDGRVFYNLPVYRLLENVSEELSLSGCLGDILIGGGAGEAHALRFAIPDIFNHFAKLPKETDLAGVLPITSHWSADDAFMFGVGFEALGWNPEQQPLLIWLAEHLIAFLTRVFPERYAQLVGEFPPDQDGSIFTRDSEL